MKKIWNKWIESLRKDRETLRTLPFRKKIRFIVDYYKTEFVVLVLFLAILLGGIEVAYQSSQEIDMLGFVLNDYYGLFPGKTIVEDLEAYCETPKNHRIEVENDVFFQLGSRDEIDTTNQSRILAFVSAKRLDFMIVPQDMLDYYSSSFSIYDLEELLPEDVMELAKDGLYYGTDGNGEQKALALNMKDSHFMENAPEDASEYYLMVMKYTDHEETIRAFLTYAYES